MNNGSSAETEHRFLRESRWRGNLLQRVPRSNSENVKCCFPGGKHL